MLTVGELLEAIKGLDKDTPVWLTYQSVRGPYDPKHEELLEPLIVFDIENDEFPCLMLYVTKSEHADRVYQKMDKDMEVWETQGKEAYFAIFDREHEINEKVRAQKKLERKMRKRRGSSEN